MVMCAGDDMYKRNDETLMYNCPYFVCSCLFCFSIMLVAAGKERVTQYYTNAVFPFCAHVLLPWDVLQISKLKQKLN